ncbi:MAG: 30S ribosomal protein S3 [Rickettsiaceae bacterium]
MGQKVDPRALRKVTLNKNWDSIFYAKGNYASLLLEDINIRKLVFADCSKAQVSKVTISRNLHKILTVTVFVKKPGIIIGKGGSEIEKLKLKIARLCDNKEIYINIREVKRSAIDAQIVATNVAASLSKRVAFKRAMKLAMQGAIKQGAKGIKIMCSGRLAGAAIARTEWYMEGTVPLHTLRADIDYATAEALTTYGIIGVKVWVYIPEKLSQKKNTPKNTFN